MGWVMRVNVYLPDELAETISAQLPDVNYSKTLRTALVDLLGCRHDQAECSACAAPLDVNARIDDALGRFYRDLLSALEVHMLRGGTAEGSARIAKSVAERHRVSAAKGTALPRLSRARREAVRAAHDQGEVTVFPDAFETIDNHPDNRRTA